MAWWLFFMKKVGVICCLCFLRCESGVDCEFPTYESFACGFWGLLGRAFDSQTQIWTCMEGGWGCFLLFSFFRVDERRTDSQRRPDKFEAIRVTVYNHSWSKSKQKACLVCACVCVL